MKKLLGLLWACLAAALVTDAQPSTDPANSLVRFRISYGSYFFGDIDVELFDTDKPLTVANFLAYVESGAYDNSILDECLPGVTLQGGLATVPNPYSPAPFEMLVRVPADPPIPNESNVGTVRSNVFGTLAMVLSGGINSARSGWLFNLGDNSARTNHTVFGRVKSGAHVLRFFNTLSEGNGIQDLGALFHVSSCAAPRLYPDNIVLRLSDLPVGFYGLDCLHYNDLFNVQIILLNSADRNRPNVAITSPAANLSTTDQGITVTGTAADNAGITAVRVYLNTNAPVTATGTNQWSITFPNVPPGTNRIVAEAIDAAGFRSQVKRSFFRSAFAPLTLRINGTGTGAVSGAADGELLEVGQSYTLFATPDSGNLFVAWTGGVFSATTRLPFLMRSNLTLTAVFATNSFRQVKGQYTGLFYDVNQVDQQSAGLVTLMVGDATAYSATLRMNGKSYPFSGHFAVDGKETNVVVRPGTNNVRVFLTLDLTNGTDQVTGLVTNFLVTSVTTNQIAGMVTNAVTTFFTNRWSAELLAHRAVDRATNPAPQAGKYTLVIPADSGSAAGPGGDGVGTVSVGAKGVVFFAGTLADGTKVAQEALLSKGGQWPLYIPLYKGRGALVSWVGFDTNAITSDFSGRLNWFKQTQSARYYPAGFTNEAFLTGSRYQPPTTNAVLNLMDAIVSFANGNLTADFANDVTLRLDSEVINNSANPLTLNVSKSSGLFGGSVTPPGETKSFSFRGAVLQKQNLGSGFFLGTNQSGRVQFLAP